MFIGEFLKTNKKQLIKEKELVVWRANTEIQLSNLLLFINELNLKHTDIFLQDSLSRLKALVCKWIGSEASINDQDKLLIHEDFTLENALHNLMNLNEETLRESVDAYMLHVRIFRTLKDIRINKLIDSVEASAFVLSEYYNPLNISVYDIEANVHCCSIYTDCYSADTDPNTLLRNVKRLYNYGFGCLNEQKTIRITEIKPLGTLGLLNAIGCLLVSRYRLYSLKDFKQLDEQLNKVISALTLGVDHVQKASISTSHYPSIRSVLFSEKRRWN